MDIKFPEEKNPFPKTMATAILSVIIAVLIGCFIGNALRALTGTDPSVMNTTTYTDYMYAIRAMFTDADQLDSYMDTAERFRSMNGLRLYGSREGDKMLAFYDGAYVDADELFPEDIQLSLREMMNTEEALYGQEDTAGNAIENVRLFNVAVEDNVVYYYLYYDDYGYIGIAYDDTETVLSEMTDITMALTDNSEEEQGMWYLIFYLEDE